MFWLPSKLNIWTRARVYIFASYFSLQIRHLNMPNQLDVYNGLLANGLKMTAI